MNNFARKCYPILSSKPCSEKNKSVKKETRKPQNRHDDEDQLENIEVQQKLKKARVCSRVCTVVVSRTKTLSLCRGNPRSEEPPNGKQISFCQIHTKGAFHLSELAGRIIHCPTSQFENEINFFQEYLLKNHLLRAYYS